jgi:hypothetical protein
MSQDRSLVNFIQWKRTEANRNPLDEVMREFREVPEHEVIGKAKLVYQTFVELFFEMGPHPQAHLMEIVLPVKEDAFESLVVFLTLLCDPRFKTSLESVQDLMENGDLYRSNLPCLSQILIDLCEGISNPSKAKMFRRLVKSWGLILRMILSSCKKDLRLAEDTVKRIVQAFGRVFETQGDASVMACQTLALHNLDGFIKELSYFSDLTKFEFVRSLIDSIELTKTNIVLASLKLVSGLLEDLEFEEQQVASLFRNFCCLWTIDCFQSEAKAGQIAPELAPVLIQIFRSLLKKIEDVEGILPLRNKEKRSGLSKDSWFQILQIISKLADHCDSRGKSKVLGGGNHYLKRHSRQSPKFKRYFHHCS